MLFVVGTFLAKLLYETNRKFIEDKSMGKCGWDGNFKESKYVETGNMVNDVIENNGRILHEETSDGYTHEIVHRGNYISDDYYFPRREPGKKPHIHYEIRSNGMVLIDGKPIKTEGGNCTMGYGRQLDRNHGLDAQSLKKESDVQLREGKKLHELGAKFESDKGKLEDEIEKVQNSKISDADKRKLVTQLKNAITKLQEQYDKDVSEEEKNVQEELESQFELMQEAADEMQKQADSLRKVQMDAASTDASAAADTAEAQKQVFENMKNEYLEKLNLQMEQAEMQRRNIRNRRLSGR